MDMEVNLCKALDRTRIPTTKLSILDNRAATFEKLGKENYILALRDAKRMIKIQKTSARGYLRAGKIFQIMGESNAALETYAYGLYKIPPHEDDAKSVELSFL